MNSENSKLKNSQSKMTTIMSSDSDDLDVGENAVGESAQGIKQKPENASGESAHGIKQGPRKQLVRIVSYSMSEDEP